jgi:hypothetical protein
MSDQSHPTAPREPDRPALRAVFADQLRPDDLDSLERLAGAVLELTREMASHTGVPTSAMVGQLAACADDIEHVAGALAYYGAADGDVLERWESRLGDVALTAGEDLIKVAGTLRQAIAQGGGE